MTPALTYNRAEWKAVCDAIRAEQSLPPWTEEEFTRIWNEFLEKKRQRRIHLVKK